MVAQITDGTAVDRHGRPFRRRNHRPAVIVLAVLFVVTAVIWTVALTRPANVGQTQPCNPPPAPADPSQPALGQHVSEASMDDVTPAKLADTTVRVLNASGRGGQAAEVAGALRDLGFIQPAAANDPVYAGQRLTCQGQIRFGPGGRAAAATVWLVAPCTELYEDRRPDNSVDLALGTDFTELARSDDVNAVLASLRPDATAPPDRSLVADIHAAC